MPRYFIYFYYIIFVIGTETWKIFLIRRELNPVNVVVKGNKLAGELIEFEFKWVNYVYSNIYSTKMISGHETMKCYKQVYQLP